jgi:hypothetical protein
MLSPLFPIQPSGTPVAPRFGRMAPPQEAAQLTWAAFPGDKPGPFSPPDTFTLNRVPATTPQITPTQGLPQPPTAPTNPNTPLSAFTDAGLLPQTPQDKAIINQALNRLQQIQNPPQQVAELLKLGVVPLFASGQDAMNVIRNKGIRVEFGDMGDSPAHAQWIPENNMIMINAQYRGDQSPSTLYAISEAIYHEAGHAAFGGDGESSIQEELNCLGLNSLAHQYHTDKDPAYAQSSSSSPLIANGVALYARLFFEDPDPKKQALINRVVQKYGDLPLESPNHMVPWHLTPNPIAPQIQAQKLRDDQLMSANPQATSASAMPTRIAPSVFLPSTGAMPPLTKPMAVPSLPFSLNSQAFTTPVRPPGFPINTGIPAMARPPATLPLGAQTMMPTALSQLSVWG